MQPIPLATRPFERIGMDMLKVWRSTKGNRVIVVITDYFTKWAITRAVPRGTGAEIAQVLVDEVFCKHGSPKVILTDRGKEFQVKLLQELYRLFESKHVRTSSYHPQTNGLTERANGTLSVMLSMYTNRYHNDWDDYLPFVTFAYNTVVQESTKFPPFTLLYGYDAPLPTDVALTCQEEDAEVRYERMQEAREWALKMNEIAQGRQKSGYDKKRHSPPKFIPGDIVLIHRPRGYIGKSSKLRHPWEGPFTILSKSSDILYKVRRDVTVPRQPREEWVSITRMKLYTKRDTL